MNSERRDDAGCCGLVALIAVASLIVGFTFPGREQRVRESRPTHTLREHGEEAGRATGEFGRGFLKGVRESK